METKQITLRLPESLYKKLKQEAERLEISLHALAILSFQAGLEEFLNHSKQS